MRRLQWLCIAIISGHFLAGIYPNDLHTYVNDNKTTTATGLGSGKDILFYRIMFFLKELPLISSCVTSEHSTVALKNTLQKT